MTFMHVGRSNVVLMPDALVEAVDDIGDREYCRFLEAPLDTFLPQGLEFW